MFKVMILLKRKENLSFEDFRSHWLNHHAVLVRQLPGIRKAVFNFSGNDDEQGYDGVSELWFDSEQDFLSAYASDIGQQVTEDALSHVSKRERILLSEHRIV